MPSLQHDHLHQDMTPDCFTRLGTQPWNTRNCTVKKKNTEEGQHIESIPRRQRNQLVHLCYSWSKRNDLPGHHPVTKSHQAEFHSPAESMQDGTEI